MKRKKTRRPYHSRASRVAEAPDWVARDWIARTGENPDQNTAEFRIAEMIHKMSWRGGYFREEYASEVASFVGHAVQQGDAATLRKLAEAIEQVERYWATYCNPGKDVDLVGSALALSPWSTGEQTDDPPTVPEYQRWIAGMSGVYATGKTIRKRIHQMGLPRAKPGAPKRGK